MTAGRDTGRRGLSEDLLARAGKAVACGTFAVALTAWMPHLAGQAKTFAEPASAKGVASESGEHAYDELEARVVGCDATGREIELSDGGVYARGFDLRLPMTFDVDEDASSIELTDARTKRSSQLRGSLILDDDGARLRFLVPEGTYERAEVRLVDRSGVLAARIASTNVAVDATPPTLGVRMGDEALRDGTTLGSADELELIFADEHPIVLEDGSPEVRASVRGATRDVEAELGPWEKRHEGDETVWVAKVIGLEDGPHTVHMEATDQAGNVSEVLERSFVLDTTPPVVSCEYDEGAVRLAEGEVRYFDRPLELTVDVVDQALDLEASSVCGIDVSSWLEGTAQARGVSLESWQRHEEDGLVRLRMTMRLDEGTYLCEGLVRAIDELGHESGWPPNTEPRESGSLVVDTESPVVRAFVDVAPSYVSPDGELAVLNESVAIRLVCEDVAGLAAARLEGGARGQELTMDFSTGEGTLALGEVPLTRDATVVVTDKAQNSSTWSLSPEGMAVTTEGVAVVSHAPLEVAQTGSQIVSGGHPRVLIADADAPTVSIGGIEEGAHLSAATEASVIVGERGLGYLVHYEPGRPLYTLERDGVVVRRGVVSFDGATETDDGHAYSVSIPVRQGHVDDGDYVLRASLVDLAGNESEEKTCSFVVDTVSPELRVTFDDEGTYDAGRNETFHNGPLTARLTLVERTFTADELNSDGSPVSVRMRTRGGEDATDARVSAWHQEGDGLFSCEVSILGDGTYEFVVSGADQAGNALVGGAHTEVGIDGTYESGPHTVDATAPRVTFAYASQATVPHAFEGLDYFDAPVPLIVTVRDQNLDTRESLVSDSAGRLVTPAWEAEDSDGVIHAAMVWHREETSGSGDGLKRPLAHVRDMAGNETEVRAPEFIVDQTAPEVTYAHMSKLPSVVGTDEHGEPLWFYNEQDGVAPVLTLAFSDEFAIADAWVEDPDGAYAARLGRPAGEGHATLSIPLKDFDLEGDGHDTVFDRGVRVFVRDMADNVRTWSLSAEGFVDADRSGDVKNVPMDGAARRPASLVKDTTSPTVSLFGIDEGDYLNKEQVVRLSVHEHGMQLLRRLDSGRVVANVRMREGRAEGAQTSWDITVAQLEGEGDDWVLDQTLLADGHYVVSAHFADYAGNESNVETTREFTVDRTPPRLEVSWDNIEMRNGMYYRAPRTATVQVTEHNFDPDRVRIETTGVVGQWSSEGDVHVCKVRFDRDAPAGSPHGLKVSGSDMAGNEASPYAEPEFAIDTHAPTVEFLRRVSTSDRLVADGDECALLDQSAFAQAVAPVVVCSDDASFDARGVDVRIEGKRGASSAVVAQAELREPAGENGMRVSWGNLGLVEGGEDADYLLEADDVYTLTAQVRDLAGNVSPRASVTFSVNRYGSNFFVEPMIERLGSDQDVGPLLFESPRIVVHEVNVSGSDNEDGDGSAASRLVTKEYAHATTAIEPSDGTTNMGYVLVQSRDASERNPYEGWTETRYEILPGNFGEGSSSDHGDGGQGSYRVDVASIDRAQNNNTTASFWESDVVRAGTPRAKGATVAFELDERGPKVEDLRTPERLSLGGAFTATFRLRDEVTQGDYLDVLVDGEPVSVRRQGTLEEVGPDDAVTKQGVFAFDVEAAPLWRPRSIEVRVRDYTGQEDRVDELVVTDFKRTTLVAEAGIAALVAVAVVVCWRVMSWKRLVP